MPFHSAITIRSETAYLTPLRAWVEAAFQLSGQGKLRGQAQLAVSLALTEAVDNAIIHAHGRRAHLPIEIAMAISSKQVILTVVDSGPGIGELPEGEPELTACRGRGLFLIRRVMNRVKSEHRNGRHALRMVLNL